MKTYTSGYRPGCYVVVLVIVPLVVLLILIVLTVTGVIDVESIG